MEMALWLFLLLKNSKRFKAAEHFYFDYELLNYLTSNFEMRKMKISFRNEFIYIHDTIVLLSYADMTRIINTDK